MSSSDATIDHDDAPCCCSCASASFLQQPPKAAHWIACDSAAADNDNDTMSSNPCHRQSQRQHETSACNPVQRKRRRRVSSTSPLMQLCSITITVLLAASSQVGKSIAFMNPNSSSSSRHKTCINNIRCHAQLKDDTIIKLGKQHNGERESNNNGISMPSTSESSAPQSSHATNLGIEEETANDHSNKGHHDHTTIPNENKAKLQEDNIDTDNNNNNIEPKTKTEEKDDESFTQFNVVNDLITASNRGLDSLSKAHHTMMAKTSNMRRQRFVTGKYPLTVSVKQNPTNKWLGLAESQIYLNGTSIEKSLASYDIFNWLSESERRELHGDYEFLSLELLAEIHVKKPGYVNILPGGGAGLSLLKQQQQQSGEGEGGVGNDKGVFGKWKSWKLRDNLAKLTGDDNSQQITNNSGETKEDGERLWMTGFSLTNQRGELHTLDVESGTMSNVNDGTAKAIKWPNEVASIPKQQIYAENHNDVDASAAANNGELEDALLVTDGFLVPGKDKGGLYVVRNPGNDLSEWRVCLTGITNLQGDVTISVGSSDNWFYHRAIWMDLTGDGRQSILAARAKLPLLKSNTNNSGQQGEDGSGGSSNSGSRGEGQLVWLERPMPHSFDANTGTPLDVDGTVFDPFSARNTPWKLSVLDEGPDVMFSVADLDPSDDTIEVIASQFFGKKLTLHSLKIGPEPKIVFRRTIDDRCGSAFSSVLADLDGLATLEGSNDQPMVVDSGSTVVSLKEGDSFSHLLVTSHECSYAESSGEVNAKSEELSGFDSPTTTQSVVNDQKSKIDGGSLFGYRIPIGKDAWKTKPWARSVMATGFKVQGQLNNMINPGAPGFCYTFFPTREGGIGSDKKWHRPLIGISGDCAESAYILRPIENNNNASSNDWRMIIEGGEDKSTNYALMCEIKCKATVGSLAIGYDDLYSSQAPQQSGYAKIYVPCYEQDKVLVFAMGSGEEEEEDNGGW